MKPPRFRISSILLVVVIAALDFAVIRALLGFRFLTGGLLILGALPMANILAVSLLIGQRRPRKRPFLWGFVPFGTVAWALYVATATFFPYAILTYCMAPVGHYLDITIKRDGSTLFPLVEILANVVMMGMPQVVFALIGGLCACKFMRTIRISKRPNQTPAL